MAWRRMAVWDEIGKHEMPGLAKNESDGSMVKVVAVEDGRERT